VVEPSGSKRWLLRTVVQARRRDIGLGGLSLVPLAEARTKALAYRKVARDGGDPLAERRRAQAVVPTFAEAAEQVHAANVANWRNGKHAAQWINTLRTYAFPAIGSRPVNDLADLRHSADFVTYLADETGNCPPRAAACCHRSRLGKTAGYRGGDNPVEGLSAVCPDKRPS
jgi:hypothetical protein